VSLHVCSESASGIRIRWPNGWISCGVWCVSSAACFTIAATSSTGFAIHASRAFMIRRRGQALRDETLLQLGWIVRSFVATMYQLVLDPVVR
jgi:hypothetical protein